MTVALVTGANRGIGLQVRRELADRDITVLLTARSEHAAQQAAQSLWDEGLDTVAPRTLDVTNDASVQRLADLVRGEFGVLDVLVNNAGVLLDAVTRMLAAELPDAKGQLRLPGLRGDRHGRARSAAVGRRGRRHAGVAGDAERRRADGRVLPRPPAREVVRRKP